MLPFLLSRLVGRGSTSEFGFVIRTCTRPGRKESSRNCTSASTGRGKAAARGASGAGGAGTTVAGSTSEHVTTS